MIRDLLTEAAAAGDVRNDVAPGELASYCLHALTAAASLAVQGRGSPVRHGHSGWVAGPLLILATGRHPPSRFKVDVAARPGQTQEVDTVNLGYQPTEESTEAVDPVCGMTVDIQEARSRDLVGYYESNTYYFCGKGCKLDFEEDPGRYLDPSYTPSM